MFQIFALLALVGSISAGAVTNEVGYANAAHAAAGNTVISQTLASQTAAAEAAAARDATLLQHQVAAQEAIIQAGILRNAKGPAPPSAHHDDGSDDGSVSPPPTIPTYTAPVFGGNALNYAPPTYSPAVPQYSGVSARDAAAISQQIATQNAINQAGVVGINAVLGGNHLTYGSPAFGAPGFSAYAGISNRDAAAINQQIAQQNAINRAGVVGMAAVLAGAPISYATQGFNPFTGVPAINPYVGAHPTINPYPAAPVAPAAGPGPNNAFAGVSPRDAAALNQQIATLNAINNAAAKQNAIDQDNILRNSAALTSYSKVH